DGQKENDLKHARYLLRPLGVIQVEIDGGKVDSCAGRGNRMADEDKGNKAKGRKKGRSDPVFVIFVFVEAAHIFSITPEAFLPGAADPVTGRRFMLWGETPTRTFCSPVTLTRIRWWRGPNDCLERISIMDCEADLFGRPPHRLRMKTAAKRIPRTSARAPAVFNNCNADSILRTF